MDGLGDRLAELRKDHGYTQDYIAEYLNIVRSSVSAYELGVNDPPLSSLIKLADLYNVSLDYLLCRIKEKVNLNLDSKHNKDLLLEMYELLQHYTIIKK